MKTKVLGKMPPIPPMQPHNKGRWNQCHPAQLNDWIPLILPQFDSVLSAIAALPKQFWLVKKVQKQFLNPTQFAMLALAVPL